MKMDVDLLRPGTVPISPDTVLWFEFLLDHNLLKNHLSKRSADPSATDLIIKFSSIKQPQQVDITKPADLENPDSPTLSIVETEKFTKKQLALKVLCLKVAAYLKWNLSVIENKLPPQIQSQLMQDLVNMATEGTYSIPPHDVSEEYLERGGIKFSMVLYHRWLLRFLVNQALFTRNFKPYSNTNVQTPDINYTLTNPGYEKLVAQSEESRKRSLQFLSELAENKAKAFIKTLKNAYQPVLIPTMDTFVMLTEDTTDMTHNWDNCTVTISENEFFMQINYDLCANFFFYRQYEQAKKYIVLCNDHKERLLKEKHPKDGPHKNGFDWNNMEYASVTEAEIFGYMKSLNISQEKSSLLHELHESAANNYDGLINVLQVDNLKREIPLVHRLVVELDIQGVSSSGAMTVSRDLLNKVAALNVVRSLLDGNLPSTHIDFNKRLRIMGPKYVDLLFWAFAPVLNSGSLNAYDKSLVKQFFLHLATSEHNIPIYSINEYLARQEDAGQNKAITKLFDDKEIDVIMQDLNKIGSIEGDNLPLELLMNGWDTPDFSTRSVPELELGCLRQRLIDATTADKIRECLVNLAITKPVKPLWTVNPQWKLPIPLQNVIMSLPRGFLQDFSYIILGKAKQQAEMGDHCSALELLLILETETKNQLNQSTAGGNANGNPVLYKLCKLVGWEAVLMQINQMLAEWPHHKHYMSSLINKCTMCIIAMQSGDSVVPRMEIVEQCYICLLNAGEWKQLAGLASGSRGTGQAEAAVATALAAHHLRNKPTKKLPEDLWDMVFPIFVNVHSSSSSSTKRNNSGNAINSANRDSSQANNKMKDGMTSFFSKLRDPTVLSVVISLLAKLFNIQKDDSNMDLNMEYIILWPAKVSSTISLHMVSSTLHQLVTQALKYYPNNISWIKLLGDMSLVGGHYSTAMKQYLSALTILSDNFVQPLSKQLIEDQTIFRRMIKCCMQLNCPTQAAILCQFLEEIDYVLAFKCLSEMSHLCSDAMDSYYGCIWDTSILEYLINLHHKRGETHRKQLAVKVMGMLELNSNNNEEIQREAANKRKSKFMRALVKQYVC